MRGSPAARGESWSAAVPRTVARRCSRSAPMRSACPSRQERCSPGPAAPQSACSLTARARCCCNGPVPAHHHGSRPRALATGDAARRASLTRERQLPRPWRLASINAAVRHVPSLQTVGRDLLREGDGRSLHTLHGDLQPSNILEHRGASAVIDPVGIAGPREPDVANAALYNNWGEEPSARIRRLAELTGTDPAFALRFGQLSEIYAALATRS
jgi:hypothetical protein